MTLINRKNFGLNYLSPLFIIFYCWFYLNFCLGYFLSKIFSELIKIFNQDNIFRTKKKLNFKQTIKIIIKFFLRLIKNWLNRVLKKFLIFCDATVKASEAIKIFLKKFNSPRKLLKLKKNINNFRILLEIFMETILIYKSLVNEIFFYWNRITWIKQWKDLLKLLMKESLILTTSIYLLLFSFLGIFGLVLGLLFGFYKNATEIFIFLLLILLKPLTLDNSIRDLSIIFPFEFLEPVNSRLSKVLLEESFEQTEIPFPILRDPITPIDVSFYEFKDFQFQVFYFYQNVAQEIESK